MSYSEFTHLSVMDQRHAELRRELDEIRAARGLPADDPNPTLKERGETLVNRFASGIAQAFGRAGVRGHSGRTKDRDTRTAAIGG
ncbi:MAG TPA: hypothetical protein VGK18_11500 [Propionicimonas sp.]|jgi:hypothetical protein|uniref:hypothetical protein n=1 Tax=Propionicimonas sp. TaxID=1955623 RepID=UPI002F41E520